MEQGDVLGYTRRRPRAPRAVGIEVSSSVSERGSSKIRPSGSTKRSGNGYDEVCEVNRAPPGEVPAHLSDASYRGAMRLGHGAGYDYPHDDPRGWVPQDHRPPEVAGRVYYEPSDHGFEREVAERMGDQSDRRDR